MFKGLGFMGLGFNGLGFRVQGSAENEGVSGVWSGLFSACFRGVFYCHRFPQSLPSRSSRCQPYVALRLGTAPLQ